MKPKSDSKHVEWKVGVFVAIALAVIALLMLNFSKGSNLFKKTYELKLRSTNVGGIKEKASVLMSGVPIGNVSKVELAEDGKSVVVSLRIAAKFKIHEDAVFQIEQLGFLGDQYISVSPQENKGEVLKNGDEVQCRAPFDLQEAARSALGLIKRVDSTVAKLNEAVTRVDQTVLGPTTLTNIMVTFDNFRGVSESASKAVDEVKQLAGTANQIVSSNGPSIGRSVANVEKFTDQLHSITNLLGFSDELSKLAVELQGTVATNRTDLTTAVKNIREASDSLKSLTSDLQSGKGMVGGLLKDENWRNETSILLNNLTTLSSNLNRFGLLYKPKQVKTNAAPGFYPAQKRTQ